MTQTEFPPAGKRATLQFREGNEQEFFILANVPLPAGGGRMITAKSEGTGDRLWTFAVFEGILMAWTGQVWKTMEAAVTFAQVSEAA